MIAIVATQVRPEMAVCIDNWYFENALEQDRHNTEILKTMEGYTEFVPTAFMLGYVEGICGRIAED